MPPTRPTLTDRARLQRQRARARGGDAFFLHGIAADEIKERLAVVNRSFTAPVIVSGWPDLHGLLPNAELRDDTDDLGLQPAAYDLAIHALGLHWADDPLGQIIQCARALKPDGLFLACLFGGQTLHELRAALAEAEVALTGGLSPRVAPMAEIRDLGGLMQRAGLAMPVADAVTQRASYPDLPALMRDLRAMGETNALAARSRRFTRGALFDRAAEIYAASHPSADGGIEATFEIICLTGWAPHPDQPKPLRPGSATQSLAQALERAKTDRGD